MNGLLFDAASQPITGASTVPNVGTAILGLFQPLALGIVTQEQDKITFEVKNTVRTVETSGSIQSLKARELELKPEGERSWIWLKIYALPDLILKPGDIIVVEGLKYKVMGSNPRAFAYGYAQYHVVDDYALGNVYQ